ncbi:hypothetical protein ABT174_40085, partial [Streptomyces sparsogenes]
MESCNSWASRFRPASSRVCSSRAASRSAGRGPSRDGATRRSAAVAGFRAVAMDLRGVGGSDRTPRGYDPANLA